MRLLQLAVTLACLASAPTALLAGAPMSPLDDVPYADVGGRSLLMDVFFPTDGSTGPWPLVIYIHGGGWTNGTHNPGYPPYIGALPNEGFAVASIQYRLTSEDGAWGGESVTFPAQIHDVKGAVRFLRSKALEYNLDPTKFAAWGPSAGGHLTTLLATSGGVPELEGTVGGNLTESSRVQVAIDYYGPTDLLNMNLDITIPPGSVINHDAPSSGESALLGFDGPGEGIGVLRANRDNPAPPFPELMILATQVNPISWVDPTDPPIFIAHGESDVVVPTHQSQRLADALTAAGVLHELHRVPGMGHEAPPSEISVAAGEFLRAALGLSGQSSIEDWSLM